MLSAQRSPRQQRGHLQVRIRSNLTRHLSHARPRARPNPGGEASAGRGTRPPDDNRFGSIFAILDGRVCQCADAEGPLEPKQRVTPREIHDSSGCARPIRLGARACAFRQWARFSRTPIPRPKLEQWTVCGCIRRRDAFAMTRPRLRGLNQSRSAPMSRHPTVVRACGAQSMMSPESRSS